jgi:GntR family transcriptional regulator/MocR family aminotransferase
MLRPWFSELVLHANATRSVSMQVVQAVIEEIVRGRLTAGTSLPGTREVARGLGINRKTVVLAYEELEAQGWVVTESRRGTFVADSFKHRAALDSAPPPSAPSIQARGALPERPLLWPSAGAHLFDDGLPDQRLIPIDTIAQAYAGAARTAQRRGLLSYGDPRGTLALREAVSKMLNLDRSLTTTPDNVCITRGSQMALYIVAHALIAPGDAVAFEELSYPPAMQAFRMAGARIEVVGVGEEGVDLNELEALCRKTRIRALYLTPHHQFPTTVHLPPSRRFRLRALAQQFGFAIIEDDYDHEFHFAHQPIFPLASNDESGHVIYIGSFSKVLSPSLRAGYIAASRDLIDRLSRWVSAIDRQGDPVSELAIVELIESGTIRRHIRRMHGIFMQRRDRFAELLGQQVGDLVQFDVPSGGLAFWLRLAHEFDESRLVAEAHQRGLDLLAASSCALRKPRTPGVRVGFASMTDEQAQNATAILSAALKETRGHPPRC